MIDEIRQGLNFIYCNYTNSDDELARKYLTKREYGVFAEMSDYDKVHSVEVLKMILENPILHDNENYLKLALLHDCGKGNCGLIRRAKKVIIGDKYLEGHSARAYDLLKDINQEVAELARDHHNPDVKGYLKRFQRIDDHC